MGHIKSEELCERCLHSIRRCMDKWDEDGKQCSGCEMNRGAKGKARDAMAKEVDLPEHICICDEILDGTPCEFFKEVEEK